MHQRQEQQPPFAFFEMSKWRLLDCRDDADWRRSRLRRWYCFSCLRRFPSSRKTNGEVQDCRVLICFHHRKFAFTPAAVPVNTSSNRISIGATRDGQSVLVTVQLIFVAVSDLAGSIIHVPVSTQSISSSMMALNLRHAMIVCGEGEFCVGQSFGIR